MIVLFAGMSFAQSGHPKAVATNNGWTRYENGFSIELPSFIGYDVKHDASYEGYANVAGCLKFSHENDPAANRISPGAGDDIELYVCKASKSWKKLMSAEKKGTADKIVFRRIGHKHYEALYFQCERAVGADQPECAYTYRAGIINYSGVYTLLLQYNPENKSTMDSILPRISASFH